MRDGSAGYDTEQALLLTLLGSESSSQAGSEIRKLAARADWGRLLRLATHALTPYLADRLEKLDLVAEVPTDVRERLITGRRANGMIHLLRLHALRSALSALGAQGIPVIVLKGMALAHLVYPDPALRPMQDIDLWVGPSRLDEAAAALVGAGFRFPDRTYFGLFVPETRSEASERLLELPDSPIQIELHGRLSSFDGLPGRGDLAPAMWARTTAARLGDVATQVLSPEDLLLHLSLHLARQHHFNIGLVALVDIRLTLEKWKGRLNESALASDCRRPGMTNWILLALDLAQRLLGAPVPTSVAALPRPDAYEEMSDLALEQIWGAGLLLPPLLEHLATAHDRSAWFKRRISSYFHGSPAEVVRRLRFDLTVKLPKYLGQWRRGELSGPALRERLHLARQRARLENLVQGDGGGV